MAYWSSFKTDVSTEESMMVKTDIETLNACLSEVRAKRSKINEDIKRLENRIALLSQTGWAVVEDLEKEELGPALFPVEAKPCVIVDANGQPSMWLRVENGFLRISWKDRCGKEKKASIANKGKASGAGRAISFFFLARDARRLLRLLEADM